MSITTGEETKTSVKFCPDCGSAAIRTGESMLLTTDESKGTATCAACGWVGVAGQLLAIPLSHDLGGDEGILRAFVGDVRVMLAKHCALPIGMVLLKWGFLDQEDHNGQTVLHRAQLSRYMTAITHGILRAVIETKQEIEKEKVRGS